MKKTYVFIFCLIPLVSIGQQVSYFNNIYSNNANNTKGFTIIDDGSAYVGYGLTTNPSVYQLFYFYKYSYSGELLEFKTFYEPYHDYYAGNVGGAMKRSSDGTYYFAYHLDYNGETYGRLMKMDQNLDTIWTKYYLFESYWTMPWNSNETADGGFIITGNVWESGIDTDLLLIKTDSTGNQEWLNIYGSQWAEQGTNVIQTPDGGYLIGGYFWKPGTDHSLDAMVVKTDSLGNEQWTKYFGNPDVDDDMAFVQMAGDGNYLVATVYGEYIWTSEARAGRINIIKIDQNGDKIWDKRIGQIRYGYYLKNFKQTSNNEYIINGWSEVIDSSAPIFVYYPGWMLKLNQNGDSLWFRDYYHFESLNAKNYIYDVAHTMDNGYIAIGQSNEAFTPSNMWVLKVDSMGCDTPGCATGTWVRQIPPFGGSQLEALSIYPNPVTVRFKVSGFKAKGHGNGTIRIYSLQGIKVEEIKIPKNAESTEIDVSAYPKGLYYLQYVSSGRAMGTGKFVKN